MKKKKSKRVNSILSISEKFAGLEIDPYLYIDMEVDYPSGVWLNFDCSLIYF